MIDKKIDGREGLKKIYNHYLDERKDNMKSTEKSYQEQLACFLGKEGISLEQITTPKKFLSRNDVNNNFKVNLKIFNRIKKHLEKSFQPSAPADYSTISN